MYSLDRPPSPPWWVRTKWMTPNLSGENSSKSVISWLIIDLFGTNEHKRISFCHMCVSLESCNLSWENSSNSAISLPILDIFGTKEHQRIPFCPLFYRSVSSSSIFFQNFEKDDVYLTCWNISYWFSYWCRYYTTDMQWWSQGTDTSLIKVHYDLFYCEGTVICTKMAIPC